MPPIQYIGENLLPLHLGHFSILLAFVMALLSFFAFFMATQKRDNEAEHNTWRTIGRIAFGLHGLGVITVMGCIFYVLIWHKYEYHFAWKVVNEQLPFKYIFSAFWQEQEGSFLLWMFWHVFMGGLLMASAKKYETPVLSILALIQVVLMSMLLGVYFGIGEDEIRIGSNPLRLLRDEMPNIPLFQSANYLDKLEGRGLNPLLQNWWMTIHPPTLFYGFASTSIPFCFAVAGLWLREHRDWVRAALPWALMSGAVLGTGILMGGAWAYEALSFGGYWAWDPVENMSLVPWLILVAAIHSMLIVRATGRGLRSAYLFSMSTFVLICYSTFLTRSGILGDTSVHAFTEMGLHWQLVGLIALFAIIGFGLFFKNYKAIAALEPEKEESIYSKEFWIFIGTLVLLFSSVLITFTTSIPVWNKIIQAVGEALHFKWEPLLRRPPLDAVAHYNQYQVWIGVLMGVVSGFAQWLRFKADDKIATKYWKHLGVSAGLSLVLTLITGYFGDFAAFQFWLLFFASYFVIFSNLDYVYNLLKNNFKTNLKMVGSALSHVGFGLLFVGAIWSGAKKQQISADSFMKVSAKGIEGFTEEDSEKNVLLYKKLPTEMSNYQLTYESDTVVGLERFFKVHYKRFDKDANGKTTKNVVEEFDLNPNVLYTIEKDKVASSNPDTKHYLTKDVFTHITSLPIDSDDPMANQTRLDSVKWKKYVLGDNKDTIFTSKNFITYEGPQPVSATKENGLQPNDIGIKAILKVRNIDDLNDVRDASVMSVIRNNEFIGDLTELKDLGIFVHFDKIDPTAKKIHLSIGEAAPKKDFIVLSAIVFPGINLVWLGSIMMMFGLLIAMFLRIKQVNLSHQ
jgi:cytochrome c-type biogenesis protein CcmF